ncbi:hypothetical protein R0H03_00430 [Pediococcus acidilactici]|uniref:Uncharacterized protein n=2 Tax=Pediococcus acidilactici TaxID=1254 RepID=A0AAW8YKS6_PEDAC|nr:hypothetical protein [Pediococcus acidilactici]MDB8860230.1 hypothetical protein [Pediococcus acidilactici]MDB8863712.1 hypothetical protein [Pediococcus acidilactici]MDB8867242.1 hypothetical protein [Pediococcus acidilactici]MDV2910336.1 hypothetical protein [Pediococcus acidilactici]WQS16584.1 hypothetical protein SGW14_06000 [Pediococcus acidilactici]
MLTKRELKKIICNRFWMYNIVTDNNDFVLVFIGRGPTDGFLAIQFEPDGRITFPNNLAFVPQEYAHWDFDEEKQEILLIGTNGQISARGKLPVNWLNDSLKIQLFDGKDGIFISDTRIDAQQTTNRVLGGKNMYFTPRQSFNMALFHDISRENFNLKVLDYQGSILNFFDKVYEYLAQHPQLEKVVIAKDGQPVVKLPKENQLVFLEDDQRPSFTYFAGNRARIMELLILILSENNKRLLNLDDHRTEDELLLDTLNKQYQDRYTLSHI